MMTSTPSIALILLAAGEGTRCDGVLPKQFTPLNPTMNVWQCAAQNLRAALPDVPLVIVGNPAHQHLWDASPLTDIEWVAGGKTRSESVKAGLEAVRSYNPTYILLHDAARPFVPERVMARLMDLATQGAFAAIPAIPATDTIKQAQDGIVQRTLPRDMLYHSQTPQLFHYTTLLHCYDSPSAHTSFTDEAELCEREGIEVQIVEGDASLFKITTAQDIERAKYYANTYYSKRWNPEGKSLDASLRWHNSSYETITAMGYDVHRLVPHIADTPHPKQVIRLGGIDIPHTHSLLGHSDADVVLHALTDALLGTIAAGDIGQHFPPSDPRFHGMDSSGFVRHALQLVVSKGGELRHVDITIIGEQPKIFPHRAAMQQAIATLLALPPHRVSIKATTTEGLGFTGRKEGIAAHALISVSF
jgi:2-C-methyl-D-erythritol 4-phosphate cytidylyltransferase/2-C-methyl-D-erythritol 2,4-cyclodiphosphate synthase